MSFNNPNLIPNINKQTRFAGKENNHSLSPNIRPLHASNKPIQNNLFPKNQIMFNNNNHHYNIKVNKITRKKEKIIEGDLNFNENSKPIYLKNIPKNNFIGNNKQKKRGMPNKSPIPIPGSFKPKDILSFNRIFSSNSRYIRKQEQKKFNKTNNLFRPSGNNNNYMNNYIFGGNLNMNMSKSFNNKKNDRSHSPLLRPGDNNKFMNLGLKGQKNRYISKSPNLGKSSIFNRNGNFSIALLNNNIGKKKFVKKIPNNNSNLKKINNINPNLKRNTIISGEINQDSFGVNKFNNNKGGNISNVNLRPISNNNTLNVSSNNTNSLQNNHSNNSMNVLRNNIFGNNNENVLKNNFINLNGSNSHNNIRNIARPISPKNNPEKNKNHLKKNNIAIHSNNINKNNAGMNSNINNNNNKQKEEPNMKQVQNINFPKNEEKTNNENQNNNQDKNIQVINNPKKEESNTPILDKSNSNQQIKPEEESHQKKVRSQSQTPINPLQKDNSEELSQNKNDTQKSISITNKKVIKKIRDILPYTHVGFDGEEPKENNQDNYFIFKNFADHKDYIYMSVCDGHGVEGHFVSEFIKEVLPYYMSENLKNKNILTEKEITHQIITETFLIVNNMLVSNENINSLFSGSTCVSVIFTPERLIVPNIGDSRAVLARFDKNSGKYKAIELSRDHKPTEKDEAKRIYENDGRIQPFTEDGEFVGPQRVWIKDEEVPGLAMTRSFGDRVAATVGVMSEPEIKEFDFDENDKYMIIASDGIWEFISSQECVDIIQKYYENNDLKGCCEYLYQESSKRWLKEEEVIDDTTLILVFFE